jgi:hypothetical protein
MTSRFEYEVTRHAADTFREVVYFCSQDGSCSLGDIHSNQLKMIEDILNERGMKGWEVIQVSFGKGGMLVFWKRLTLEKASGPEGARK